MVEYRAQFLRKMVALGFLNWENAPTPEAKLALPEDLDTPLAEVLAKTIVLFHDESTFQANDYERTQCGTKNDHMLVPKSRGAGIMISDFISEEDGYLCLTDEEFAVGREKYPQLKQFARRSILSMGRTVTVIGLQIASSSSSRTLSKLLSASIPVNKGTKSFVYLTIQAVMECTETMLFWQAG